MACDGNEIDTMFVDHRRDGGRSGQTLVNAHADFYVIPFMCCDLTSCLGFSFNFVCSELHYPWSFVLCAFCRRSSAVRGTLASMRWAV